ncbi:MAG: hypothetical protein ACOCUU_01010 [Nanoarchaeota archaeon]
MENKKRRSIAIALIVLIFVFIFIATYLTFFFKYPCQDLVCFRAHQESCNKAQYTRDTRETNWKYEILGKENENCRIKVTAINIKSGDADKKSFEGKSMICSSQIGELNYPENSLSQCHGRLKEEIQNLIIKELHSKVVENIGEINKSFNEYL